MAVLGPNYQVHHLADRPEFAAPLAELQWAEWGSEEDADLQTWIRQSHADIERAGVPAAFVAVSSDHVLGGVSLRQFDIEERRDRSPWVSGMIVSREQRGRGVGAALIGALEQFAWRLGTPRVWCWTASAEGFYVNVGWRRVELLERRGAQGAVLVKEHTSGNIGVR